MLLQSLWVHVSFVHIDLEILVFLVSSISIALTLCLHFQRVPSNSKGEGIDGDIPIRIERSKVFHSTLSLTLDLCIGSNLLQEQFSLKIVEEDTHLSIAE